MASSDWETIKQIFSDALNVPASARDAYVERACEGREDVRRAVAELLRAHTDASHTFLEPNSIIVRPAWLFASGESVAGRFRVIKPIARGAMGEVYQVHDERLRLPVALKAIRPELLGDAESVERFRREVLVTRDIAHDSLCRVFDLVEHPMRAQSGFPAGTLVPCLTMQLLDGINLEDWLSAHRPMPTDEAMPIVRQIAEALQVLHDAGVVHRDLKPSNVMLVASGSGMRAVLTDFGLAKPLEEGLFETQRAVHAGAPFFMAPELFRGQRPSRASDIYAFGLLIDEMVTTTRAFSADSLHSLLLQKLGDGAAAPSARATAMPRVWERTIQRCLAQDPRDRYRTPHEVVSDLTVRTRRSRWRGTLRWLQLTYFPRRWRLVTYSAASAMALSGAVSLGSPARSEPPTSVAISRFANLTNNRELDYLAIGTASELGRRFSRVSNLYVYSPIESGTPLDASRRATFALRGHVQQVGQTLRITVEISDAAKGRLLWSQNFDGQREQALEIEDQLASATVGQLMRLRASRDGGVIHTAWSLVDWLTPAPPPQLPSNGTVNSAAFDAYLRGKTLFEERTQGSALEAERFLKRAITEDPNFAAAYAALADVQGVLMDVNYAPHNQLIAEAEKYVNQAVALDPNLPEAQLSLGLVRQMQWRWADSEAAYRRAIELHPTSARARRWYGGLVLQFGRVEEALQLHRKAIELDPYDFPSQSAYGFALFQSGRATEAAAQLEAVLARKDMLYAHALLGQTYAYLGARDSTRKQEYLQNALRESEIVRTKENPVRAVPNGPVVASPYADLIAAVAWSYHGEPDAATPFLDRLTAGHALGAVSPGLVARVHAAQGNVAETIASLLQAEAERDRELYYINVSPLYAEIRNEPQFRTLVERLHLSH